MRRIVVGEHARLFRRASSAPNEEDSATIVDARLYDRLRRFDRDRRPERDRVFDWRDGFARTTQWVGVVQIAWPQVEVHARVDAAERTGGGGTDTARSNLLYMLAVSGDVPIRSRDIARLTTRGAPLSETLAAIFANR